MSTLASRDGEWLDLVAELMAVPLRRWPFEEVARELVETFAAPASTYYATSPDAVPTQLGWPPEHFADHLEEARGWSQRYASTEHPLLRYHLVTGDTGCMQVAEVPRRIADDHVRAAWEERGRRWGGVQSQLSLPLLFSSGTTRSVVVGRADPFTRQEMWLARRLQRLLTGLDRQICAYAGWSGRTGPLAVEAANCLRLTPRELAVLELLAQGLTAGSIARRLAIAERTVQKHLQRCYAKLGVPDRLAAVLRAQHIGLLDT